MDDLPSAPIPTWPDVTVITRDQTTFYLVGTAHVSAESVALAETVIRTVNPGAVAIELCGPRLESLRDPEKWRNTDVIKVIRQGRGFVLFAQVLLASFQKRLGRHLPVKPGAEMLKAADVADELHIPIVLADREVRTTLKRLWASLGIVTLARVLTGVLGGLFSGESLSAAEVEKLKSSDALHAALHEFEEEFPAVREVLIAERDKYMAARIAEPKAAAMVAIIGAGHIPGISKILRGDEPLMTDLSPLEEIPPPSLAKKCFSWGIPLLFLALVVGSARKGFGVSLEMLEAWFWINGFWAALGACVALAHPLTILSAFIAAPFTAAHPLLASGWVAGLVEAVIRRPRVSDFETVADDMASWRGWWRNRLSRLLLVMLLTNLFGSIGTIHGLTTLWSLSR